MRFDVITLFPELFEPFTSHGVARRAFESGQVQLRLWNLRAFGEGPYRRVDDRPYGGGPGMVMLAEPLWQCLQQVRAERGQGAAVLLFSPAGRVLDVACGQGRHLAWFVQQGHPVLGLDRDAQTLAAIELPPELCQTRVADIESQAWPLPAQKFAGVVVTNYLWRPLLPTLINSVDTGGVLIYETFAEGQGTIGRPSRPNFLLRPGELLQVCQGLRVVAYEDGFDAASPGAAARFVQRIAAVREGTEAGPHAHRLA
jgi:SAM-dependent methyltransferase